MKQDSQSHRCESRRFRVIPVLDLRGGQAVHARGGSRAGYRPVQGILGSGDDPVDLAKQWRDRLGFREIYVADLDALAGGAAALAVIRSLAGLGLRVVADVGLRDARGAAELHAAGVEKVVAPTETLAGRAALGDLVRTVGSRAVVLGLDLRDGVPIVADGAVWPDSSPRGLVASAVAIGVRRVLILDLRRIGAGDGPGTIALGASLRAAHPGLEVLIGGGVAGLADLEAARAAGVDGVLVASALHDGRLGPRELAGLTTPPED